MSLNQYLKSFSRLRTDKNRKRRSALTTYQAPHKPFLLLSIMDLTARGSIAERIKICLT
jgi:putative restriction endonuclease